MKKALFTIAPHFCPVFFSKLPHAREKCDIYVIIIDNNNVPKELPNGTKLLFLEDLYWGELHYKYIAFGLQQKELISVLKCAGFYALFSKNYEYVSFLENDRITSATPEKLFHPLDHTDAVLIPKNPKQFSAEDVIFFGSWESYFYAFKKTPSIENFINTWLLKSLFYGTLIYPEKTVFASDFFLNSLVVYTEKIKHGDGKDFTYTPQHFTQKYIYDYYTDGEKIRREERLKYHSLHPSEKKAIGDPFSQRHKISNIQNLSYAFIETNMLMRQLNTVVSSRLWRLTKHLRRIMLRIVRVVG